MMQVGGFDLTAQLTDKAGDEALLVERIRRHYAQFVNPIVEELERREIQEVLQENNRQVNGILNELEARHLQDLRRSIESERKGYLQELEKRTNTTSLAVPVAQEPAAAKGKGTIVRQVSESSNYRPPSWNFQKPPLSSSSATSVANAPDTNSTTNDNLTTTTTTTPTTATAATPTEAASPPPLQPLPSEADLQAATEASQRYKQMAGAVTSSSPSSSPEMQLPHGIQPQKEQGCLACLLM